MSNAIDPADEMLSDFLDEASQLVDRLNDDLLKLEAAVRANRLLAYEVDLDLLNNMFRSAHSIKGLSAMLGLANMNRLTHRLENVLDAARKGELPLDPTGVEVLFRGVDRLGAMLQQLRVAGNDECEIDEVIQSIETVLTAAGCVKKQSSQADAERILEETMAALQSIDQPKLKVEVTAASLFATIVDETEIPGRYLSIFIDETEVTLDQLASLLVDHEAIATIGAIEPLLVGAHRIKGSAASLGLNKAAKLSHLMEDVLQQQQENSEAMPEALVDSLLHCTDALRNYLSTLKAGSPDASSFPAAAEELVLAQTVMSLGLFDDHEEPTAPTPTPPTAAAASAVTPAREVTSDDCLIRGVVKFDPSPLQSLKASLAYEKLLAAGHVVSCEPTAEEIDRAESVPELRFVLETSFELPVLQQSLFLGGVESVQLTVCSTDEIFPATLLTPPAASDIASPRDSRKPSVNKLTPPSHPTEKAGSMVSQQTKETSATPAARPEAAKPTETLRVDIERLDQLMNLTGQLVINKARFTRIADSMKQALPPRESAQLLEGLTILANRLMHKLAEPRPTVANDIEAIQSLSRRLATDMETIGREMRQLEELRFKTNELLDTVHQLDRVSMGIQKSVMDIRMVPVGPLFQRFKRVIRDITRLNEKDIQLVIRGEKTELDKRMIDELGDPLIHMVRNSADHGVESAEDRVRAGKSRQGTITLDAFHRGNSIVIQVSDDGKGLDRDRILAKAIERGIVLAADADKLTSSQIYNLIWEPGFSTAEKVTEISGRGMGMDIVRAKIEGINGRVEIDSRPGEGCTFTVALPLTMAILPSLMLEAHGDTFAVPIASVVEIVSLKLTQIASIRGTKNALIRDRVVPIVDLGNLFQWSRPERPLAHDREPDPALVVVTHEGRDVGLIVDRLLGEEDVVIKSLAEHFQNVEGVAGASILGDGSVSLILDVAAMIGLCAQHSVASV